VPQSTEFTDFLHKTGEDQTQVRFNNDNAGLFNDLDVDNEGNERNDEIEDIVETNINNVLGSLKNFASEVIYSLHYIISIKLGL